MSIYSLDDLIYFNNVNDILHDNLIGMIDNRSERSIDDDLRIAYDGSGPITIEPVTYVSMTIQSVTEITSQSSIVPTTEQTFIILTTIFTSSTITDNTLTTISDCNLDTYMYLFNGTCALKIYVQIYTANLLRNDTGNSTIIADALSLYINSVTNTNISSTSSYILLPGEIDAYLGDLSNINLVLNTTTSFIMVQQLDQQSNITTLGAFYTHNIGGDIINSSNQTDTYNRNFTAGAVIYSDSLSNTTSFNILIIDKPTTYENIDNSTNATLASSVIVVKIRGNSSAFIPINISLYFQVLNDYRPHVDAIYSCSFYNMSTSSWSDFGCTLPQLNIQFNRYECSCNHLSTFALVWSPNTTSCNTTTSVIWINGTCISKSDAQKLSYNALNNATDSSVIADILSIYVSSITNTNVSANSANILSIIAVDEYLNRINNVSLIRNTNDSILVAQPPYQKNNTIILGASFTHGVGGEVVKNTNKDDITQSNLSAAAIISAESLVGVTSLKVLIIDTPTIYRNIDNSTNKTLASSIILVSIKKDNSFSNSINISLYFRIVDEWKPNITNVDYYCSFYDNRTLQWNESGCTKPIYNRQLNRYECSCNHLTSFALLWLPNVPLTTYLNAQDIASLVFQSISILCFIFVIVDAIRRHVRNPSMSFRTYDLLPLISTASTTILFIFYIALGMTVYTRTSSSDQQECFLSSSVLMFFVYFFLIFMFCTKTSVGYFNYLRFVRLFPEPSYRKLFRMLIVSFFISITWVAFAAGFNSNSSFRITQLYPYKLCWFTRSVVYYFLTIPVCIFILINIILFILVGIRMINHTRRATSRHQSYHRMKICVIILLSSGLTQGIGWLSGVFVQFLNQNGSEVFGWIFIILNGLEGFWSIVLYIILRLKHIDEQKRVTASKSYEKTKTSNIRRRTIDKREPAIQNGRRESRTSVLFDDLNDIRSIESDC